MNVNQDKSVQGNKEENTFEKTANEADTVQETTAESSPQEDLEEKLTKMEAQAASFKDKYLRSIAEMENLKKRSEKERSDYLKFGNEKILQDLLPILDSFEKAAEATEQTSLEAYIEGTQMVFKQLTSILEKHGLKAFESKGEEFDPNRHQAIQKFEDSEVDSEIVKDEFQRGYHLNERLLRPAIVSVSVPQEKE